MPRTTTVECSGCPASLRAICSDSLGFLKVIQPRLEKNGADSGPLEVVARWGQPGLDLGISVVSISSANKLAVARKSGVIEILDSKNGTVCAQCTPPKSQRKDESDTFTGLHLFKEDGAWERAVLSCQENSTAALQKFEEQSSSIVSQWEVSKAGTILSMKVDHAEKYAAFGGKGVELNLWDLESSKKIWDAKKPKADHLLLIPPAWVTACTFLTKENHGRIAAGTGDHQIRVYDVRAQRRHVLAFDYGESPIKALTEDPDGFTLFVGTGAGDMGMFDTRTGKLIGGFKGKMAGSVRSIARHPSLPLVASCGLDRFLRVHDVNTRQLAGKVYLKQPLVSVVFDDLVDEEKPNQQKVESEEENMAEQEVDKDKPTKKKKTEEATEEKPPPRKKSKEVNEAANHRVTEDNPGKKKKKAKENELKMGKTSPQEFSRKRKNEATEDKPRKKKTKAKEVDVVEQDLSKKRKKKSKL